MYLDHEMPQHLKSDGYVVIKNILSKQEVKKMRGLLRNHFKNNGIHANKGLSQPNAAVEVPALVELLCHSRVLQVMRFLLQRNDIMFTSHCDLHWRTLSGWHKDDGHNVMEGGYFGGAMYDKNDCQVYKMAFYLQDHSHNKGGLTVKKGSHRYSSVHEGKEIYLKTNAGDAIVFDVRLSHCGQRDAFYLRKIAHFFKKYTRKATGYDTLLFDTAAKKIIDIFTRARGSIFFTYGAPDSYTKSFSISNMERQIDQTGSKHIFLEQSVKSKFITNGVLLVEDDFVKLLEEKS